MWKDRQNYTILHQQILSYLVINDRETEKMLI
jgi:hypothetical protein